MTVETGRYREVALADLLDYVGLPLEQLLEYGPLAALDRDPAATAYIAGSLTEGLGNCCSDIDVVIVTDSVPYDREEMVVNRGSVSRMEHLEHRRVEFEYVTPSSLKELASLISDTAPIRVRKVDDGELVRIHRVRTGLPLINPAGLQYLRSCFDFAHLRTLLISRWIQVANGVLEDLHGLMDDHEGESALLRTRDLLMAVQCALCAHLGYTNPNAKWRRKILTGHGSSPELKERIESLWSYEFPDVRAVSASPASTEAYVRGAMDLCNRTIEWIEG